MAFTFGMQLFGAFVFFTLLSQVIGHSYITSPTSRSNQRETLTGCRGPSCLGPCDVPLSRKVRAPIVAARGSNIEIKWPRNNHAGGFIRFAWAPTSESDNHAAFDSRVQQINCHEVGGCHPDDLSNPNGGDTGPSDGSTRACASNFTIPTFLTDGEWTLQWAWFGGAFALGDYYSCVDYRISGGSNVAEQKAAVFIGGDFTYPTQNKCKFFNTDKLHVCVNEPCTTGIYPLSQEQSGIPSGKQTGNSPVTTGTPTTVTTASPAPATTGTVTPVTSAAPSPVTTGPATQTPVTPAPATTGTPAPVTTGTTTPVTGSVTSTTTTGTATSTTTTSGSTTPSGTVTPTTTTGSTVPPPCALGQQICLTGGNQYQTCTNGRESNYWAQPQSCQTGLKCHTDTDNFHIRCY